VTTHVTEAVVEVEAPTPFEDLSDDDRWEAVLSVSEDTPMFCPFDILEAIGIASEGDQANQHQAVAEYLDQCVSSSALWNVSVSQGVEENTKWFCEYYILHPEKDFMRGPNQA
jgi:hypothetical protein